jgi:translocation and assembly module TamB
VVALALGGDGREAALRLDGGWRDDGWRGRLAQLDVGATGATLRLQEPVALRAGVAGAELERACLDTTGGTLCLAASHAAGSGRFDAALDGLSLAALRAWIGDDRLPAMEGLASGTAEATWSGGALRSASLRLQSPRGLARLPRRPDLDLGYRDLLLEGSWDGASGRLDGGAVLVPEGRIELAAELTSVDGRLGWDATVDLRVSDLSGVEAFTTAIAEPEGELRGQLRLRGGALPASTSGALALTGFTAQVPGQALRLREGVLVLAGVPGQLVLRGSVVSGDGTLSIDGRIDRDDPVPAILRLGGTGVRIANTPNLSLLASPDLTLALRDGRWQLDGTVDIPRARINAARIETGASRSPDVMVVDDPATAAPQRPWRARVRVTLGDDVRLTGFGFDGSLAGALDVSQRQGAQALASGEVTVRGRYDAYGQRLTIERGGLRWANSPLGEPTLDLRAERRVRGETVALEVRGSALRPESRVVAGPGVSDSDALALLVTGRPLNRAGAADREQLSDAAAALGAVGSEMLTRGLRGRLGLDEIGVSSDTRLDGEAFTFGKFLSPRLYVGYGIGILTRGEVFTVRYLVTDRIEVEANAGQTQRAAVNWRIER